MTGDGILVGKDGVAILALGASSGWILKDGLVAASIDGRDDAEVVLEAIEMVRRRGESSIQRIQDGWIERAKR